MKRMLAVALCLMFATSARAAEWAATLQWAEPLDLGVPVSGIVKAVNARPGQRVPAGHILLRLDARAFEADVEAAEGAVAAAQPTFDEAARELERSLDLYDRGLISTHEKDLAEVAHGVAKGRLAERRAELINARLDHEYSILKAPYAARVREVLVGPGQSVVSRLRAEPLLRIARADRMLAVAAVGVADISGLNVGERATVEVAGKTYSGELASVGVEPLGDGGNGPLFALAVEFGPGTTTLRPGQLATVTVP